MQGEHLGDRVGAVLGDGDDAPKGEEGSRDVQVGDAGQSERRLQTVLWVQTRVDLGALDLSRTRGSLRWVAERYHLSLVIFDDQPGFRDRYHLDGRDPGHWSAPSDRRF